MPSLDILFDPNLNNNNKNDNGDNKSTVISTPLGLTLIEIQGDLSLPKFKPSGLNTTEENLFKKVKIPDLFNDNNNESNNEIDMVKFGHLEIDNSSKKATLFISTTQRLIGTIEKIDPPLGILKVTKNNNNNNSNNINNTNQSCEIIDIIKNKIIFKNRPLPIM